jgi:hypothetical protein
VPAAGIEDPDPACTGPAGEFWWQAAWQEGLAHGFPPPQQHNIGHNTSASTIASSSSGGSSGGSSSSSSSNKQLEAEWVLLMASPAYRAHQQMHIHIGRISSNKSLPMAQVMRSGYLDGSGKFARGCISSEKRAPSVRVVKVNSSAALSDSLAATDELESEGVSLWHSNMSMVASKSSYKYSRHATEVPVLLISVFVAARSAAEIASRVRPFDTARAAAAAVPDAVGVPYVLMLTAHSQPKSGCDSTAARTASVNLPAALNVMMKLPGAASAGTSRLVSAITGADTSNHGGYVSGFVVTAMIRGSSPEWVMEGSLTKDCFDTCPLPPKPS